jgi:hypothetical protein
MIDPAAQARATEFGGEQSRPSIKYTNGRRNQAPECSHMVPADRLAQAKCGEHRNGDDFPNHLQLRARLIRVADAIGGNSEAILKVGDVPSSPLSRPQRHSRKAQLTIPGEDHEPIRAEQKQDRQTCARVLIVVKALLALSEDDCRSLNPAP